MFKQVSDRLAQAATLKSLAAVGAMFVIFSFIFTYADVPFGLARLERISGGLRILDLQPYYTPEMAYRFLDAYQEEGRRVYLSILTADLFYPLAYSSFLALAISWVFRRAFKPENPAQFLNLLPFVAALLDYAENVGVYTLLRHYPERLSDVAQRTAYFSAAKLMLSNVCVLALAIGVIFYLARRAGLPRPHQTST